MTEAQQKAWDILTPEEKTALSLSLSSDKSTWEAGEIMGKAHYKYLEIRQRAEKFFIIFTEYFNDYPTLIPKWSNLDTHFKKYLYFTIIKRLPLQEAIKKIDSDLYKSPKPRGIEIAREVQALNGSKYAVDNNLFHLIKDFDRWNNFRILPPEIQEMSAFKRRNKHRLRKLVTLFTSLDPVSVMKLKQIYRYMGKKKANGILYLPIITVNDLSMTEVIPITHTSINLRMLNSAILYAFKDKADADRFMEILKGYIEKDYKHCRDGQQFWPEFRILTKRAINHDDLMNIVPSRKYLQDNAFKDMDLSWHKPKKDKNK